MGSVAALFLTLALAADPSSIGIPIQLPQSPLHIDQVASNLAVIVDHAKGRAEYLRFEDCVSLVNRSPSTVTHEQVVFAAVDRDGTVKGPKLPFDLRETLKPGESSPRFHRCRSDGYGNGENGLWLVAWVNKVDFADGTSWHAPPEKDVLASIASAVREYGFQR